ncbi:MAG: ComF family protein [Bacteroidia bacterium]|nr:ComF family protein [Bacteroidia bacterium]
MIRILFEDLLNFFFPNLCAACEDHLVRGEKGICMACLLSMPVTGFEHHPDNPVMKQFWGKVPVHAAMAYCHFNKGGRMQKLIHQLKYDGRPDIGVKLGQLCASRLIRAPLFSGASLIVPVPLHPGKERLRGYNQAASFGEGLAEVMRIPQWTGALQRKRNTATQTRKHRFDRASNVLNVFEAVEEQSLAGKHILLVDDVITTGSTLVSAAEALLKIQGVQVSIVTIAFARG